MRKMFRVYLILPLTLTAGWLNLRAWGAAAETKTISYPVVFEKNVGQAAARYGYVSQHGGVKALFSGSDIEFSAQIGGRQSSIRMRLAGARPDVIPAGRYILPSVTNYLLGNEPSQWLRAVPNFSELVYPQIYSGVDLVFHGAGNQMEHDFRIAAGSDPGAVQFQFEGSPRLSLDADGNLKIAVGDGQLIFDRPVAYQESSQGRSSVEARFKLNADGSVQFDVGKYDPRRELVIDPVFRFSTYLASNSSDSAIAVTTDSVGNIYVAGYTGSGFPIVNGIQPQIVGNSDAYVAKLDPTGHTLLYSTYLGGSNANYAAAIAIDTKGNIIVTGTSSSNDFPHAGAVPALTCQTNDSCPFITSLTPDGSHFNYSGLVGGTTGLYAQKQGVLAVDGSGNAYIAGVTDDKNFVITAGTLATSVPGYPYDSTFVMKIESTGALSYSTIVPGNAPQSSNPYQNVFFPNGIAVDSLGQATIAGMAGLGLPTTLGVVQPIFPNDVSAEDASAGFVLQLNAKASAISYATYVPGTDIVGGLAVGSTGDVYVTGATSEPNLPVSANAYQKSLKSGTYCTCNSGFILELNGSGTAVLSATYLEGTPAVGNEGTNFTGIALDSHANVFVGGMTGSTDFPLVNPFVSLWVYGGSAWDMVLAEMSPDLSSLLFGSFLSSVDQVFPAPQFSAMTVGSSEELIVVGSTDTTDFPTTAGSFQPTPPNQANHGFVAGLLMSTAAPSVCLDAWGVNFGSVLVKAPHVQTVHLTNCGNSSLQIQSMVSSASTVTAKKSCATLAPGAVCAVSLTYTPQDTSFVSGTLTITNNAAIPSQVINFSGQGVAPQLSPATGSANFGHLLVNTKGVPDPLFFLNVGTYPLTFKSVSVDGEFSISGNTCAGTLQIYAGCSVSVVFAPTAAGIHTGSVTIVSNDPVNPRAAISLVGIGDSVYALPLVSSLKSSTGQIQNGAITIQVFGASFYPASVVRANGVSQATTFLSDGELQATLASDVTNAIGELQISVSNPTPGGGTSVTIPFTRYQVLNLSAAFLAASPSSNTVYASLPFWSPTDPNTVIPINALTGSMGTPITVGNDPGLLALSSDGKYLFVVANQDQTVQRIDLSTKLVEKTFNFPPNNCSYCGMQTAVDLKGVTGSSESFVLALTGEVALYNSLGLVNSVPTTYSEFGDFTSFAYAGNPSAIYTLPFTNAQSDFFNVITMGAHGLSFPLPQVYGLNSTTGAQVVSDGNLLYTSSGEVWNPAKKTQTGSFPLTVLNSATLPNLYSLVMDTTSGHIFSFGNQSYQSYSSSMFLSAFGTKSLGLTGSLAFPTIPTPYAQSLVRWGTTGFAFIAQGQNSSSEAVYVLSSSLASAVSTNPVPKIRSMSPTSILQDSSGAQLTINGQGFNASSVVNWNGSPLQTSYVDATVLTAATPSADLASAGSVPVNVVNPAPGGGTSNSVSFTISPPTPLISFSSSSVTFPAQKVGTASPAVMIAVQNPGTAALNISSIKIAGADATSFSETNNCGAMLAPTANCAVYVSFDPSLTGALNATLTFTDGAAGSPQIITLQGTGD